MFYNVQYTKYHIKAICSILIMNIINTPLQKVFIDIEI